MAVNVIPISGRNKPLNAVVDANGSYTLPQHVFVPHPVLQQISSGHIASPSSYGVTASGLANNPNIYGRPYPGPNLPGVHGIRMVNAKVSPGAV
jgi:hypothetical protein